MIASNNQRCKVTVDGTDFKIRKPADDTNKWISHKFKSAGVRYEVGVSIATGYIAWFNGPFQCGANPDITVFRKALKFKLGYGERVEADRGYRGEPLYISTPDDHISEHDKKMKNHARARHEQINSLFKNWASLNQTFRNDPKKHGMVFQTVAFVTQLQIKNEEILVWDITYHRETFADSLF